MKILKGIAIGLSISCFVLNLLVQNLNAALGWFNAAWWQIMYAKYVD